MQKAKRKEPISKDTLDAIKKELLERKDNVTKELLEISNTDGSVKFFEYGSKADENAQEIEQYTTDLATEKVLESTLRDINSALERIENGTYGVCKYCGIDIPEKRLKARPVASACVECKTKLQNS